MTDEEVMDKLTIFGEFLTEQYGFLKDFKITEKEFHKRIESYVEEHFPGMQLRLSIEPSKDYYNMVEGEVSFDYELYNKEQNVFH